MEETIKKNIIKKAVDNGYKGNTDLDIILNNISLLKDFSKCFFGDEYGCEQCGGDMGNMPKFGPGGWDYTNDVCLLCDARFISCTVWEREVRKLLFEKDKIKYLSKFINIDCLLNN